MSESTVEVSLSFCPCPCHEEKELCEQCCLGSAFTITEMQEAAWEHGESSGFHGTKADVGTRLMLMVTEISEAMEEWRAGHDPSETYYSDGGKPEGVPAELADVVIRIGDFCGIYGIDLEAAIKEKMKHNETRPHLHGGKRV